MVSFIFNKNLKILLKIKIILISLLVLLFYKFMFKEVSNNYFNVSGFFSNVSRKVEIVFKKLIFF